MIAGPGETRAGAPREGSRAGALTVDLRLRVWGLALLAVTLFVHGWDLATPGLLDRTGRVKGSDYMRLYVTGALADRGGWDRYFDAAAHVTAAQGMIDPRLEMSGLHPNYGPAAGLALAPLSRLPFLWSYAVFCGLSVCAFAAAAWLLIRNGRVLDAHVLTASVWALAFPGLYIALRYGQLSAITTLCFAAAAVASTTSPLLAGVLLGLAAYKPNLLVVPALVFLLARQWRLLAGLCLSGAAHLLIGAAVAGFPVTMEYVSVLLRLAAEPALVHGFPAELHSIPDVVRPALGPSAAGNIAVLALTVAIVSITVWLWRRTTDWRVRWSALVLSLVLVSPHVLTYDLLLLIVPIVLGLDIGLEGTPPRPWWWLLLALVFFAPLISPSLAHPTGLQISTLAAALLLLWVWRSPAVRAAPA